MTISFSTFFTKAGKAFFAGNTIHTAVKTTVFDEVEDFVQEFASTNIEISRCVDGLYDAALDLQDAGTALVEAAVATPVIDYLVQTVKDDNRQADDNAITALKELIKQMKGASDSVDASTPAASVSYGGSNVGNGVCVTSIKRPDGKVNEHILAESIEGIASDDTFDFAGEGDEDILSCEWPKGSGCTASLTSMTGSDSLISNGTFETENTYEDDLPDDWVASVATIGTTLKMTNVEIQTVIISGTPTGGWYTLSFTDSGTKVQTTQPIAYNGTSSDVQSALRELIGLGSVTVSSTGTTPNYTHSVTFTDVKSPAQLTSTATYLTGGTPAIAHATSTASGAYVLRGARTLEFDSNGSEKTTIQVPVTLTATTQYAMCLWCCVDSAPAAGVVTVDLVDGIGGTVVNDDAGTANSYTIDATALTTSWAAKTGVFRTPTNLPDNLFLRIRITTDVSNTSSVFFDDATLVEMTELYTGGVYAAVFTGPTEWVTDDTITLAVTNDRAGALHEWMNRVFDMRENDLLLPSNSAGGETINDSLIA